MSVCPSCSFQNNVDGPITEGFELECQGCGRRFFVDAEETTEKAIYELPRGTVSAWTGIQSAASIERFRVLWANWAFKNGNIQHVQDSFLSFMRHWDITAMRGSTQSTDFDACYADRAEFKETFKKMIGTW